METAILGQETSIESLNKFLLNPPHIFLIGQSGSGKTTLAKEFLKSYYKQHDLAPSLTQTNDWILHLSSEQDRGIHRVRDTITEFVRRAGLINNVYRFVLIDDVDSLPDISQQALRRPMEQYDHLTKFLFISQQKKDLIPPLQSRCVPIVLLPLQFNIYGPDLLQRIGFSKSSITPQMINWLSTISLGNTADFLHQSKLLFTIFGDKPLKNEEIKLICDVPPYEIYLPLIKAYLDKNKDEILTNIMIIWKAGYSFEDIFTNIYAISELFGVYSPDKSFLLHGVLIKALTYYCQSRISFLDILELFFPD
jgi:hypothetical protein